MPSLVALAGIAEMLDINPRDLLESEENQVYITHVDDESTKIDPAPTIMSIELTSTADGSDLKVHRLVLQPQAPNLKFEPRSGEIFGFVLEGILAIATEDEQIELKTWDSIHYDGNHSYSLRCYGDEPCVAIWCNASLQNDLDSKPEGSIN